jgi:hypothetical protein
MSAIINFCAKALEHIGQLQPDVSEKFSRDIISITGNYSDFYGDDYFINLFAFRAKLIS